MEDHRSRRTKRSATIYPAYQIHAHVYGNVELLSPITILKKLLGKEASTKPILESSPTLKIAFFRSISDGSVAPCCNASIPAVISTPFGKSMPCHSVINGLWVANGTLGLCFSVYIATPDKKFKSPDLNLPGRIGITALGTRQPASIKLCLMRIAKISASSLSSRYHTSASEGESFLRLSTISGFTSRLSTLLTRNRLRSFCASAAAFCALAVSCSSLSSADLAFKRSIPSCLLDTSMVFDRSLASDASLRAPPASLFSTALASDDRVATRLLYGYAHTSPRTATAKQMRPILSNRCSRSLSMCAHTSNTTSATKNTTATASRAAWISITENKEYHPGSAIHSRFLSVSANIGK